ncbi:hypothetical protein [Paenibacillus sp. FJAT-26967]|uniref:hypothetical protein n=1 Tax=Paenibacillus sp. FJAT-26967 TaxID=1729690 RepID=UPI000837DBC5|nr:hypothetical protein [Paenibacillus sp. FJAT-26967]
MQKQEAQGLCQQHKYRYVLVQLNDGTMQDGFVEDVDDNYVYLAVPYDGRENGSEDSRAYGYGWGYPGFSYYPYPYPYPRRRFFRRAFPLAALAALTLLPFY